MKRRKNELISGVEYWRCKRQVRKSTLQKLLGGGNSLQKWSRPDTFLEASSTKNLLLVADCLDVTVDQLFEVHSVAELADGDRPQRQSKYNNPGNCLSNYRIRNGLSFQQLSERLGGVSRQFAQQMCIQPYASKAGINRICRYEKMAPEEFVGVYGSNKAAKTPAYT